MGTWISKGGVWYPAKEKVGLKKKDGEPFIYEGPDRDALLELFRQKVETLGMDFKHDPDLLNRVKQLGYKDIKEYAKAVGYDAEQVEKDFNEHASVVNKHELPARVEAIDQLGGGTDTTGGGENYVGDFGEPKLKPKK